MTGPPATASAAGTVVFDLDGVLVDSRVAITTCINAALIEAGLGARDPETLTRFVGPPLAEAFAELAGLAVGDAVVERCIATYREHYADQSVVLSRPFDGIAEVIGRLGSVHRLVVATSKPRPFAIRILEGHGLLDAFAHVEGPDLAARTEHKAETIRRAIGDQPAGPAVMIGDRSFDVHGARANGLPCVGVLWGIGDREELAAAGASVLVASPAELPGEVDRLVDA